MSNDVTNVELHNPDPKSTWELESFVSRFETNWDSAQSSRLPDFLPPAEHPLFWDIAVELVRVDIELASSNNKKRTLEYYAKQLPRLIEDINCKSLIEFELRRVANSHPILEQEFTYPSVGESFESFTLLGVLGEGAFSRVFLASDKSLANRLVALKFSPHFPGEAAVLAKLQHRNIVPIYSWYKSGTQHVVCMPFYGATTFKDVCQNGGTSAVVLGEAIVSTIHQRAEQTRSILSTAPSIQQDLTREFQQSMEVPEDVSRTLLPASYLSKLTEESLLWIALELANGLSHAHARGILHRDIKPANILLTNDGIPMLVDFNLARNSDNLSQVVPDAGGTPRYMSPEHLAAWQDPHIQIIPSSDIYSLGIVLIELVSKKSPFGEHAESFNLERIEQQLSARKAWHADRIEWPMDLHPGTIDILCKMVEFDPALRYQTADQLIVDIECQRSFRPLRFNRNRSVIERFSKWQHRHPRLSSGATVGMMASVLLCSLALFLFWRESLFQKTLANNWIASLQSLQLPASGLVSSTDLPRSKMFSLLDEIDQVTSNPYESHLQRLDNQAQQTAKQLLGQLFYFAARGRYQLSMMEPDEKLRQAGFATAATYAKSADTYLIKGEKANQILIETIDKSLQATSTPSDADYDQLLQNAQDIFEATSNMALEDKGNVWYWWYLAFQMHQNGESDQAIEFAKTAIHHDDKFPWAYYLIGIIALERNDYREALGSFDKVIGLSKEIDEAYINRAIANLGLDMASEALVDLQKVVGKESTYPRIYFLREQAYRLLGDDSAANSCLELGLRALPTDGIGWLIRSDALLRTDRNSAQRVAADLQRALSYNPYLQQAYENLAYVQAELLHDRHSATETLDQAIIRLPKESRFWAARGVLNARNNAAEQALSDVSRALELERTPLGCYQAACVYLLVNQPDSLSIALSLIREALRADPSLAKMMTDDPDLDSIRSDPTFQSLLTAATTLLPQ